MVSAPPITLTEPPDNTLEQCDVSLGAYLRAWDQVEAQLLPLFNVLLGTHQNATLVLLNSGVPLPTLRLILESLATLRLEQSDRTKLNALLRRWKTALTKRNRIVHGHWMLSIRMVRGPSGKNDHTMSSWVRYYHPADPALTHKMFGKKGDNKLRAHHEFTLKDIDQAGQDVRTFAKDLRGFTSQLKVLPFVNPQPLNIDQSAIQSPTRAGDD